MDAVAAPAAPRPRWRGLIHRGAAPVALVAFVNLARLAPTVDGDRLAVIVYGFGVTAMLTVSAVYHSGRASPAATRVLKRIDHGTILLAIAGTYTAVTALAIHGRARAWLLVGIWVATTIGIAVRMLWLDAPRVVSSGVYVAVGWFLVVDLPAYVRGMTGVQLSLLALGGLLYTVGGVIYALKKPNPIPAVFGFHEVFHALVVAAAVAHYAAVYSLLQTT